MESVKKKEEVFNEKIQMKDFLIEEEQYKNKKLEEQIEEIKK